MAGGPNALHVVCMTCLWEAKKLTKATRVYEGLEDDHYQCELGHTFGIDWEYGGPPDQPQWPPGPEHLALVDPKTRP